MYKKLKDKIIGLITTKLLNILYLFLINCGVFILSIAISILVVKINFYLLVLVALALTVWLIYFSIWWIENKIK